MSRLTLKTVDLIKQIIGEHQMLADYVGQILHFETKALMEQVRDDIAVNLHTAGSCGLPKSTEVPVLGFVEKLGRYEYVDIAKRIPADDSEEQLAINAVLGLQERLSNKLKVA